MNSENFKPKFTVYKAGTLKPAAEVFLVKEVTSYIEELFKDAKVKYGRLDGDFGWYDDADRLDLMRKTHMALIIGAREIKLDSAEEILREIASSGKVTDESIERARLFFSNKGEKL